VSVKSGEDQKSDNFADKHRLCTYDTNSGSDNIVIKKVTKCAVCDSNNIEEVLKLEDTPIEDQFVEELYLDRTQSRYPLALCMCLECGYVRLTHLVHLKERYKYFKYQSNTTVGLVEHFNKYAKSIIDDFHIPKKSLVVDVGSSDGSMLKSFKDQGMRVVGIEPAELPAHYAIDSGITTINDYLTDEVAVKIIKKYGFADVITANYMYANIDNLNHFTNLIESMLSENGIFIVETGYHVTQYKIKMFDYIYHEHFSYFTVGVLSYLFNRFGLEIIYVQKTKPKGGSIKVVAQKKKKGRNVSESVKNIIKEEEISGAYNANFYRSFSNSLQSIKNELINLLENIKNNGESIIAFGASHSSTTLIYHFELNKYIDYIVDDNESKHGLYSPGYHIPVLSSEYIYSENVDYILVLAWQHKSSVLSRHKEVINSGVKFIVPLPKVEIIT